MHNSDEAATIRAAAVIYVRNIDGMRSFYEGGLGMSVAESGEGFIILNSAAWELALVSMPIHLADEVVITDPPQPREGTAIKLAFAVDSIDDVVERVMELGGRVFPGAKKWKFRGHRILDCVDPEGNVIQVRELIASEDRTSDYDHVRGKAGD